MGARRRLRRLRGSCLTGATTTKDFSRLRRFYRLTSKAKRCVVEYLKSLTSPADCSCMVWHIEAAGLAHGMHRV